MTRAGASQEFRGTAKPVKAGSTLISDFVNNTVSEYDAVTRAFQGTLVTPGSGGMNAASGITADPDGNVYVTRPMEIIRYNGQTGAPIGVFATVDQPSHDAPN